jgi:hypothetical protein
VTDLDRRVVALNAATLVYVGKFPTLPPNADAIVGVARTFETYLRGTDVEENADDRTTGS